MHSIALSYNLHKRASSSNNLTETQRQQESGNNQSHGELLGNTFGSWSGIIGRSFSGSFFFFLLHNEINVSLCGKSISHTF